jgi:shikimate dehydrogenase
MSPVEHRRFQLLGDPVDHSVSPAIFSATFDALGLRASYSTRRTEVEELPAALRAAARGGGGNVTLPHKERVAGLLDGSTRAVEATGACNCFWLDRRTGVIGDNTDVGGFLASLPVVGMTDLAGARVLLVGAGGAARAVLYACALQRAAEVDVLNRTRERALAAVSVAEGDIPTRVLSDPDHVARSYDLVVNATSLGLHPDDPLPVHLPAERIGAAMDLVYASGGTSWSRAIAERGVPAVDGVEMLVQQAALSLRRWYPGEEPPLQLMRRTARSAVGPG